MVTFFTIFATDRPAHLQHEYTIVVLQIGPAQSVQDLLDTWDMATAIAL